MKRLNQNGAVAMISVVIFSIILSVLVTAYARTIVSQQRESINYDLSTRAYYAAESGVQDAIRAFRGAPTISTLRKDGQKTCKPALGNLDGTLGDSSDIGYTCQLISSASGTSAPLPITTSSGTNLVKIEPAEDVGSDATLTLNWSSNDINAIPRADGSKLFPPTDRWSDNFSQYQPLLRTTFISVPKTGVNRENVSQRVYFLNPTNSTFKDGSELINFAGKQDPAKIVQNSSCDSNGCTYSFKVNPSIFDNYVYIAVNSFYESGIQTELQIKKSTGEAVKLAGFLTIDVTGRAGDVFRRVRQQVQTEENDEFPPYVFSPFNSNALTVGDGICKLFTVGTSSGQFNSQCTP